jgi:H+/Cl- antiporter ClcA
MKTNNLKRYAGPQSRARPAPRSARKALALKKATFVTFWIAVTIFLLVIICISLLVREIAPELTGHGH